MPSADFSTFMKGFKVGFVKGLYSDRPHKKSKIYDMGIKELRKKAKKEGIKNYDRMKKPRLRERLIDN